MNESITLTKAALVNLLDGGGTYQFAEALAGTEQSERFQKAADLAPNNPLQADFSTAASQLFETGLKRMENC